jgi:ABC-type uncharacterized transport system substrate-binding protein
VTALIENLAKLGWLEKKTLPPSKDSRETRTIWSFLAHEVHSNYLTFVPSAYWSADWDEKSRLHIQEEVISRLNQAKDLDLMLAFGTWAGLDLANNRHSIPTMVLSASDAVQAGIIPSALDSGLDHIHAKVDPTRVERQIRLFHSIAGFKKLGVAFKDTPDGRTYAGIADIKRIAGELGFELMECPFPRQPANSQEEKNRLLQCHQKLAPRIDAFYLTEQYGINFNNLPVLLAPFFNYKIPSFSQGRTGEARYGVLMALARQDFQREGEFYAQTLACILNGVKPRNLPQIMEEPLEIAINLASARKIGFRFPLDILAGAREIYEVIESPPHPD